MAALQWEMAMTKSLPSADMPGTITSPVVRAAVRAATALRESTNMGDDINGDKVILCHCVSRSFDLRG